MLLTSPSTTSLLFSGIVSYYLFVAASRIALADLVGKIHGPIRDFSRDHYISVALRIYPL